jgi:exopolysaccharide biosynthesis protein
MSRFKNVTAPEWADVELNAQGFLNDGEYVYADDENGHYIYVNKTLRVVIERTREEPDKKHPFYCFTANIWCDTAAGELPTTVYKDPEKPKSVKDFVRNIAKDNKVVFATTTDYYIYRIKASYPTGIEVRNGEVIFDDPHKLMYSWGSMPTYETLALYRDGHAESLPNKEKSAPEYVKDGAIQVYSFGPCLVKDGKLTEYAEKLCNKSYNPRLAMGVAEDGHYIVIMCEGRVKRSKGTQMAYLAQLLLDRGCTVGVNLDGGQSAVIAFMGNQLNQVVKSDPYGREQADILAFGTSDQVGTFEMADVYKK